MYVVTPTSWGQKLNIPLFSLFHFDLVAGQRQIARLSRQSSNFGDMTTFLTTVFAHVCVEEGRI